MEESKELPLEETNEPRAPGRVRPLAVLVACAAIVGLGAWAFVRTKSAGPATESALSDVPHVEGKWIRYSADFARRAQIEMSTVQAGSLAPVIGVTGTVSFDPELVAALGARIPGRVRRVLKYEGDTVRAGDVVAELESADLGQAQATLLATRAHAEAAEANERRQRALVEQAVSSQRDAELARATAAAARADVVAAEQRLHAFGATTQSPIGTLQLRTPIAGRVIDLHVSRGQTVEPSFTAARVADLSRVWIELAVFERDLGRVRVGDEVEISPQTDTSVVLIGKVARVGDVIDLEARSAPVRVIVDNHEERLRPGQSVLARIKTSRPGAPAIRVPLASLTSVDGKPTIFVARDDTSVEPRPVALGGRDAAFALVTEGLAPGERVVVKGSFALKAELFR